MAHHLYVRIPLEIRHKTFAIWGVTSGSGFKMNITQIITTPPVMVAVGVQGVVQKTLAIQTTTLAMALSVFYGGAVGATAGRPYGPLFATPTTPRTRATSTVVVFPDLCS